MRDRSCDRRHRSSYQTHSGRLYCPSCREDRGPALVAAEPAAAAPESVASVPASDVEAPPPIEAPAAPVEPEVVSTPSEVTLPEGEPAEVPRRRRDKGVGTVRTRPLRDE